MKKIITQLIVLLLCIFSINAMAQSPGISYQAVILSNQNQELPGENVEDELLVSQEVSFRFKIYNDDGDEYTEVHENVFTDRYGMVNLVIGWGTPEFQTFNDIKWDGEEKWLDVYIDFTATGTNYQILEQKKPLFHLPSPNSVNLDTFNSYMDLLSNHLANDNDTDPNNETQAISFSNDTLYLSNGGQVYLGDYLKTDNDEQILNFNTSNNSLSITNGNQVDLSSLQDGTGTDDQTLTGAFIPNTAVYKLDIEGGNSVFIDMSSIQGSDDQTISANLDVNNKLHLSILDGNSVEVDLSTLLGTSTDDQNIENLGINASNILTVGIEAGNSQQVDLSHLDDSGTDDQNLTGAGLTGTDLQIDIEAGNSANVDLITLATDSAFVSTIASDSVFSSTLASDSNFISHLTKDSLFINSISNGVDSIFLSSDTLLQVISDNGSDTTVINLGGVDNDKQNISGSSFNNNILTIGIENGNSESVDLTGLATGLDTIYSNGDTLYTVYNNYNDTARVDLSATHTDDQDLTNAELNGTNLKIEIEDGDSVFVDMIDLASDSAFVSTIALDSVFSSTLAHDSLFINELTSDSLFITSIPSGVDTLLLAPDSTLMLVTNNGMDTTFVDLSSVGTDDQDLTNAELNGTNLKIEIEDGDSVFVDVIDLASDSAFVSTIATDSVFSSTLAHDSLFINELTSDSLFIGSLPDGLDTLYVSGDSLVVVTNGGMDSTFVNLGGGGASDGDAWGVSGEDQTSDVGRTGKVGIGITTPLQDLHINGQVRIEGTPVGTVTDSLLAIDTNGDLKKIAQYRPLPVIYSSSNAYTVQDTDEFIVFQGGQNPIDVTLPDPTTCPGRVIVFAEETNNGTSLLQFLDHQGNPGGVLGIVQNVWSGNSNSVISTGNVWLMKGSQ